MLLRTIEAAARALDLPGRGVLVAASGGIDSTVLAHALAALAPRLGLRVALGHVNHGLRGAESDADEDFVRRLGATLGARVASVRVDPGALRIGGASRSRPTLQEAARRLRYDALLALAEQEGCERIATAHHGDDQAETLLLRLLRGTGPDGLGGIPERSWEGRVVRPLLRVSRAAIEAWARAQGLSWREDSSNSSPRYRRSRLRTRWLPGLASEFNPRLLRVLADLAEAQRRDSEWIEQAVAREAAGMLRNEAGALRIEKERWDTLPEALARRLVRLALQRMGGGREVSRTHIERALRFLRGARVGKRIELPGSLVLACERDAFRLAPCGVRGEAAC